jgi:hypothetical protein
LSKPENNRPHPLPEVEGSGGHQQVNLITGNAFQEVPFQSVVTL